MPPRAPPVWVGSKVARLSAVRHMSSEVGELFDMGVGELIGVFGGQVRELRDAQHQCVCYRSGWLLRTEEALSTQCAGEHATEAFGLTSSVQVGAGCGRRRTRVGWGADRNQ